MSVKINKKICIGCGICASSCPDNFLMEDNGKAKVLKNENLECAKNVAENCPVNAIIVK